MKVRTLVRDIARNVVKLTCFLTAGDLFTAGEADLEGCNKSRDLLSPKRCRLDFYRRARELFSGASTFYDCIRALRSIPGENDKM